MKRLCENSSETKSFQNLFDTIKTIFKDVCVSIPPTQHTIAPFSTRDRMNYKFV